MLLPGYVDYKRREYCKDVQCPVQLLLDRQEPDSGEYDMVRDICVHHCIHTTYEFHHWLMERGYCLVRPEG